MTDRPLSRKNAASRRNATRALAAGALTAGLLGLAPLAYAAGPAAVPQPPVVGTGAAHDAAAAPSTLDTLSRFFARDHAIAAEQAKPRLDGATVPVYSLSADFMAGKKGAPIATLDFFATKAVSADGQQASVWTARTDGVWKVVNIATGDDETRHAAEGAKKLGGGTVFQEPQINAWFVQRGDRVLPLGADAERAIGAKGTTVDAYRARVNKAYGDKLPGSAYAKKGLAGGYSPTAENSAAVAPKNDSGSSVAPVAVASTGAALAVLGLGTVAVRRRRRR